MTSAPHPGPPIKSGQALRASGRGKKGSLRRLRALAVLPVEMPVLRFQQPCPACRRSTRIALRAPSPARSRPSAARAPGREVSSIFLGGGTPSLMQPQTVGAILDAIGKHWRVSPPMSKSRWKPIPPASRPRAFAGYRASRRQPRFARRAGARRCLAEGAGAAAYRARSARCGRDRAQVRSSAIRST